MNVRWLIIFGPYVPAICLHGNFDGNTNSKLPISIAGTESFINLK